MGDAPLPRSTVAAGGAAATVFSFLFLPWQVTWFVEFTLAEVIEYRTAEHPAWILLWLIPFAAVLAGAIALLQRSNPDRRPSSRIDAFNRIRTLATMVILVYIYVIIDLSLNASYRGFDPSILDWMGIGFWFGLFGMILAYMGATIELRNLRRWRSEADNWGGWG